MSADALAVAVESLVTGLTVYKEGEVPRKVADIKFPYVLLASNFPSVSERALARVPQAHQLRLRATVTGESVQSVRIIGQKVANSVEGARPVVPGWRIGRVEAQPNGLDITPDDDVVLPSGLSPVFTVLEFVLTASRSA